MHAIVALFSPPLPPCRCSSNRGTRKKNDRASSIVPARHRSSFPSFLFSDEKSWKRGHVSKLSAIRLGLKFRPNLFDILISFFLIQKSNFDQIFVPIIDQRHRKILAVHPPLPLAKRISATPHRKQNNRASTKPQFDRSASRSVNRATIFVLARNPGSGGGRGGEGREA